LDALTQAASEEDDDHPYVFAHKALPALVRRVPTQFDDLAASGRLPEALARLWKRSGRRCPRRERLPADEIAASRHVVGARSLVVVRPPVPLHMSEAHFTCAIIREGQLERYFVLEHSWNVDDTPSTWMGEWLENGTHVSFGRGSPAGDEAAFVEHVKTFLDLTD
jgi:hypothetical protein